MSGIRTSACSRSGGHIGSTAPLTAVPAVSGASVTGARGGAAAIAHDLQTPVAVILGLCARIEDGGLTAGQQADLTRVREQAQAVSQAARTMVDSARTQPAPARGARCDVAALVRGVVDNLSVLAQARGAELIVVAPRAAIVRGDTGELRSAVTNLVTNALRQVEEGGRVRCAVRRLSGSVEIEVADSGSGIQEGEFAALLEPFAQGSGSRGSAGLGLGLVRDTVARLGGSIALGTAPEGGAALTMTFRDAGRRRSRVTRAA